MQLFFFVINNLDSFGCLSNETAENGQKSEICIRLIGKTPFINSINTECSYDLWAIVNRNTEKRPVLSGKITSCPRSVQK